ncbi:MAG: sulfotransferase [Pirellulales bacterium]|nr:sulfotransferase [Pirellulales bacterium]
MDSQPAQRRDAIDPSHWIRTDMLPNTFVIGAAKAGTSFLKRKLNQHPDVYSGNDIAFFTNDQMYRRGLEYYATLFPRYEGQQVFIAGGWRCSALRQHPEAASRIADCLPDAKIIYAVREPVKRIESLWIELRTNGSNEVVSDFNRAVHESSILIDSTRYYEQLSRYREHFPADRIRIVFFEDMIAAPAPTLADVLRFLGLDPGFEFQGLDRPENVSSGKLIDGRVLSLARRLPLVGAIRSRLPNSWRGLVRRHMKRPIEERPRWDDETLAFVKAKLGDDVRELLADQHKPAGYWQQWNS